MSESGATIFEPSKLNVTRGARDVRKARRGEQLTRGVANDKRQGESLNATRSRNAHFAATQLVPATAGGFELSSPDAPWGIYRSAQVSPGR